MISPYMPLSGGEMELLQWLDNYTFPTEVRFKDVKYAKRAYPDVVRRIINSGVSNQFVRPINVEAELPT
jgi:cytosine/adenosine deaminase-related metal-dependent hydrolase